MDTNDPGTVKDQLRAGVMSLGSGSDGGAGGQRGQSHREVNDDADGFLDDALMLTL